MPSMKGLFLLDVEEERRARRARSEAVPAAGEEAVPAGEDSGGKEAAPDAGKPLEDYLARWHGNWRGSSSVK